MGLLMAEAVMLVLALSLDSLTASFAFGMQKIKVPILSAITINIVCAGILYSSLVCGSFLRNYISKTATAYISFGILFTLGVLRILDIVIKRYINKKNLTLDNCKNRFGRLLLKVYADNTEADVNHSKTLSVTEAFTLAIALSIDSLAAGFGIGILQVNHLILVGLSFLFGMVAVEVGCLIGRKVAAVVEIDLSWISGAVLILLAFLRLG